MPDLQTDRVIPREDEILGYLHRISKELLDLPPERLEAIQPGSSLTDALQLDSLAQVVLVSRIEEDFGMHLEPEEWQEVQTISDLLRAIQNRATKPLP